MVFLQGCSFLCIVIPDKGAQRALIRYPAPLSKGAQPFAFILKNKEQNASRFGICAGFRLGARYRSLGRNDAESLGFGRNEQPWFFYRLRIPDLVSDFHPNHPKNSSTLNP
jgi:hypothetical protein